MKKLLATVFCVLVLTSICFGVYAEDVNMTYYDTTIQDMYEQTLFGQPISEERNGEYRIGIKCTYDFYAELTVYVATRGNYVPIFYCPAVIGQNGAGKHAERDSKTPLGTWVIGEAYGIQENPGALLPYTQVNEDMYWCATGTHGTNYNKLIYRSDDPFADYSRDEHLIEYSGIYDYFIDLGYNKEGIPYIGNSIFLRIWKDANSPTGGSVAISKEDMISILKIVPPGTTVTVY